MADADYEQDLSRQCMAKRPDQKMWDCNKTKGHRGCHVAYGGLLNGPSLPQWEWHDGDTVSVKAGQMKTVSAVPPAPAYQWMRIPATTAPSMKYSICLSCRAAWENGKASTCVCKKTPATEPALAQPSRRELAADVYKRVIDWGSSFRTDRERYQQWSDLVVMLRKEKAE
jgi:hypothetical protein